MIVELSILLIAFAIVSVAVYTILLLKKVGEVTDEAQQTLKLLTSDLNVTLYQTNELLAKTTVLVEDVNGKVSTLDPLFVALADLSTSVSDLNSSARDLTGKAKSVGTTAAKAGGALSAFSLFSSLFKKKGKSHGKKI